jgi:hypothetical protein
MNTIVTRGMGTNASKLITRGYLGFNLRKILREIVHFFVHLNRRVDMYDAEND